MSHRKSIKKITEEIKGENIPYQNNFMNHWENIIFKIWI